MGGGGGYELKESWQVKQTDSALYARNEKALNGRYTEWNCVYIVLLTSVSKCRYIIVFLLFWIFGGVHVGG